MTLSRRTLVTAIGAAVPVLAAGATSAPALAVRAGTAAPAPDLTTPEGWLKWAAAHRRELHISLDDGRDFSLRHGADRPRPLASALKVVHLAAYGIAVAEGRLDPRRRIRVGDWERFYVPTDGGAHPAALKELGIATDETGLYAADPHRRVSLDEMVRVMIQFSDSAVPDFLRVELGWDAVIRAGRQGGLPKPDIRSMCAEYLFLIMPEHAPPPGTSRVEAGLALERRYSHDPEMRREAYERLEQLPSYPEQVEWVNGTSAGTARELMTIHRRIAAGALHSSGASRIAREHLEYPLRGHVPPMIKGIGYKGGSLPNVLTAGMSQRHQDGTIAVGSLLIQSSWKPEELAIADPLVPLLAAIQDPAWRRRFERALKA